MCAIVSLIDDRIRQQKSHYRIFGFCFIIFLEENEKSTRAYDPYPPGNKLEVHGQSGHIRYRSANDFTMQNPLDRIMIIVAETAVVVFEV